MFSLFRAKPSVWVYADHPKRTTQALALGHELGRVTAQTVSGRQTERPAPGDIPAYIVHAGEGGAEGGSLHQAIAVKEKYAARGTKLIQILDPIHSLDKCDYFIQPNYDPAIPHPRRIESVGLLHTLNEAALKKARAEAIGGKFPDLITKRLTKPKFALLLGGWHVGGTITPEDIQQMARKLNEALTEMGGSLMITTSTRTERPLVEALRRYLKVPHYLYDSQNRTGAGNPYAAILALADAIVVTGDSVRMVCEAAATRVPLWIYTSDNTTTRYAALHQSLYHLHRADRLRPNSALEYFDKQTPLNEGRRIAKEILKEK